MLKDYETKGLFDLDSDRLVRIWRLMGFSKGIL